MITITIERKHGYLIAALLVVAVLFVPAVAWASHQFSDVPNSNPFHDDVDFIADRGITLGCGGGEYCPDDFVTREQMAAFMKRSTGVATESMTQVSGTVAVGGTYSCKTDAYTPFYEEQVALHGAATALSDDDGFVDWIGARMAYRANGGSWILLGTHRMYDGGGEDDVNVDMSVTVFGALALTRGTAYEFSIHTVNFGKAGQCEVLAQYMNRMPGQSVGSSGDVSGSSSNDRTG